MSLRAEGMRIVIVLKRNENAQVILNRLYKFTPNAGELWHHNVGSRCKKSARVFDLKGMLEAFY